MKKQVTILVIDDDKDEREVVADILRENHYHCLEASDGITGLEMARQHLPDLILCDIQMPRMDGREVLRRLRESQETVDIPFIFMTGMNTLEHIRQGMNLGADDYLPKPFNIRELLNAVHIRLTKKILVEKRHAEEIRKTKITLERKISNDPLTGLPTQYQLGHLMKFYVRHYGPKQTIACELIDLDKFHYVNESLGKKGGDEVIKIIARRIQQCLNADDAIIRMPADSFLILAPCAQTPERARLLAERVLQSIEKPLVSRNQEIHLTASLGCSYWVPQNSRIKQALGQAEAALLYVRDQGGNAIRFYTPELKSHSFDRLLLSSGMTRALKNGEFQLYYQPLIARNGIRVVGAEALLRWNHPKWGMIPPARYIPVAEDNGFILPLGEWILRTACYQWRSFPTNSHRLRLAINLSERQIASEGLLKAVDRAIKETGFLPEDLELEITEGLLVKDVEGAKKQLMELKKRRIHVVLDDFGTGYSSLRYLKQFPLDKIKIDQTFTRNICSSLYDKEIVSMIVSMAHRLGLKVVAEGVETEEQLRQLQFLGCDEFQGFLWSPPISFPEFSLFLERLKEK